MKQPNWWGQCMVAFIGFRYSSNSETVEEAESPMNQTPSRMPKPWFLLCPLGSLDSVMYHVWEPQNVDTRPESFCPIWLWRTGVSRVVKCWQNDMGPINIGNQLLEKVETSKHHEILPFENSLCVRDDEKVLPWSVCLKHCGWRSGRRGEEAVEISKDGNNRKASGIAKAGED